MSSEKEKERMREKERERWGGGVEEDLLHLACFLSLAVIVFHLSLQRQLISPQSSIKDADLNRGSAAYIISNKL